MSNAFEIEKLRESLYFITWFRIPNKAETESYLTAVSDLLNAAPAPITFLSDLRRGYIADVNMIIRLGKIAAHAKFGLSAAFGDQPGGLVYSGVFSELAQRVDRSNDTFSRFEEAIIYLERLNPGVTIGIDWQKVLKD